MLGRNPKTTYESDIKLGEKYRDEQTGIEGTAIGLYFYQYSCERVTIELVVEGKIEDYTFDAPRLTHIATGQRAEVTKTGGPGGTARGTDPTRRGTPSR